MEQINSRYLTYIKQPAAQEKTTKLKLFYTNDWHGQTDNLGGVLSGSL